MKTQKRILLARMNPEKVADEIGNFLVERVAGLGKTGGILGLSGGVDSTTTAALAKRAFDKYNLTTEKKLELVGYVLPSNTNNKEDEEDGVKVAKRLGIRYERQNIEPVVQALKTTNPEAVANNFHKGNLMSEIRAIILHGKAACENKLVLGTGNRDEDFGIGYYTLYGDGAVHLSPIGNLPKRLVREMARYLGFEDLADRVPTAGLEPGQTDFRDLGYSYDLVELVSEGFLQGFELEELVEHEQVLQAASKEMQTYGKLYGKKKFANAEEIVKDITRRNAIAYGKGTIVHPPIAEVSLEYGGKND